MPAPPEESVYPQEFYQCSACGELVNHEDTDAVHLHDSHTLEVPSAGNPKGTSETPGAL